MRKLANSVEDEGLGFGKGLRLGKRSSNGQGNSLYYPVDCKQTNSIGFSDDNRLDQMAPEGACSSANEWLLLTLFEWAGFYWMALTQVSTNLTGCSALNCIILQKGCLC